MEWILTILVIVDAALICAVLLLVTRLRFQEASQRELLRRLHDLESITNNQQQQIKRLRATLPAPRTNSGSQPVHDPLALIEQLSDMAAMESAQSLPDAAKA